MARALVRVKIRASSSYGMLSIRTHYRIHLTTYNLHFIGSLTMEWVRLQLRCGYNWLLYNELNNFTRYIKIYFYMGYKRESVDNARKWFMISKWSILPSQTIHNIQSIFLPAVKGVSPFNAERWFDLALIKLGRILG